MTFPYDLRLLGPRDAALLNDVAEGVFDEAIDSRRARELLNDPRHHLAVALSNGRVVGMASAIDYVHPDKAPQLWINEVGVGPEHRRRGLGRALLEMLFVRARELGCTEAWVGTSENNTPARRLYASLEGSEEPFVMISFRLAPSA